MKPLNRKEEVLTGIHTSTGNLVMTVSDDTKLGKKTWKSLKEDVLKYRNDLSKMPYDWFKRLTKDQYDVLATLVKA